MGKFIVIIAALFIVLNISCSSSENGFNDGNVGQVSMNVSGLKGIKLSDLKEYRVTITGEGIDEPIVATFTTDEANGVIKNIPSGENRNVEVALIDKYDREIKKGVEAVNIQSDTENKVEVELKSVPIFANLYDNTTVSGNRLRFKIMSDPDDKVIVTDSIDGGVEKSLIDPVSEDKSLSISSSDGIGFYDPVKIDNGLHIFTVKSLVTGYKSSVKVKLVDGEKLKAATLSSGSKKSSKIGKLGYRK